MTQASVQSFFSGGGGKSAKFEKIGDSITGTIIAVHEPEQSTDPNGKVKLDKNGRPLMMIRIELQTDERNPDIDFDDGVRTLYVRSYMIDAVSTALHEASAVQPELGGKLTVKFSSTEPNPGMNPSKLFEATYVKPSSTATSQFFGNNETSAPAPVKPPNFDQKTWDNMPPNVQQAVATTMAGLSSDEPPF